MELDTDTALRTDRLEIQGRVLTPEIAGRVADAATRDMDASRTSAHAYAVLIAGCVVTIAFVGRDVAKAYFARR